MKWKNKFIPITIMFFCLICISSCGNVKKDNTNVNYSINVDTGDYQNNIQRDSDNKNKIIEKNDNDLGGNTYEESKKVTEQSKYNEINEVSLKELNSEVGKYMDKYVKLQGTIDYIDEKEIICEMIISDGREYVDIEYYDTTDYFKGDFIDIEGIVVEYDDSHTYNEKPVLMATIEAAKIGNIISSDLAVETKLAVKTDLEKEFIFLDSDKEKLVDEQIKFLDNYSLKIARNEIFARHGYTFESPDLKEYFSKKDWYKSNVDYNGVLNSIEAYNVNLILKEEESR